MKRPVFHLFLIWLCLLLYLFNSLWLKQHSEGLLWYLSVCYISDFLAPVVMLSVAGIALSSSGRSIDRLWQVLLLTFAFGLFWELGSLLIPEGQLLFSGRALHIRAATFDPTDFIAYFAGGLTFWFCALFKPKGQNRVEWRGNIAHNKQC